MSTWQMATFSKLQLLGTGSHIEVGILGKIEPFKPGQFIKLALYDGKTRIVRAYSHAQPYHKDHQQDQVQLYIVFVAGGQFTSLLKTQRVGNPVWIQKQSSGHFTLDRITGAATLWMICTGTGIAPYLCTLREGSVFQQFERIYLLHGIRRPEECHHQKLLDHLSQKNSGQFYYYPCFSKSTPPGQLHGRVTTLLETGALLNTLNEQLHPDQSRVLLCGNPGMIREMRSLLTQRYAFRPATLRQPGELLTEQYWSAQA